MMKRCAPPHAFQPEKLEEFADTPEFDQHVVRQIFKFGVDDVVQRFNGPHRCITYVL